MGLGPDNPRVIHDLSTISRRSDLDWLTTTNTEIRTQSPHNTSSPRPPMYPSQPTPPNVAINPQRSGENPSSSAATSGHPHFRHHDLSGNLRSQSRGNKKGSSSNPSKPKGTPGRKRKFQDHEVKTFFTIIIYNRIIVHIQGSRSFFARWAKFKKRLLFWQYLHTIQL